MCGAGQSPSQKYGRIMLATLCILIAKRALRSIVRLGPRERHSVIWALRVAVRAA
jgi:hypothetical protein